MKFIAKHWRVPGWLALSGIWVCLGLLVVTGRYVSASTALLEEDAHTASTTIYVPVVLSNNLKRQPFGFVSTKLLLEGSKLLDRGTALDVNWVNLRNRISWERLQPNPGDPIDWGQLTQFEKELRALKKAGMTPLIAVQRYPHWAVEVDDVLGQPSSCGPLRADKFDEFAEFMRAVVHRYETDEFDVHNWELGNEPDVDPQLLPVDWGFGCWGDIEDPFYGGRHYGEMIKVVSQAIKAADPTATVWLGGLLLGSPDTTDPEFGKPEFFFKGVLEAGAGPYIDVVPYHWWPRYLNSVIDHDLSLGKWADWGGGTVGKAQYLRQIMDEYGVDKPVFLNETGFMCVEGTSYCTPSPAPSFYSMQADNLIRSFVRGLSIDVEGFIWFTLNGLKWRYTGLLDENDNPNEAYFAYQHLVHQLKNARYSGSVNYDPGVESYAFKRASEIVQVVWARADQNIPITIPVSKFIAAYDRDGDQIVPTQVGNDYQLSIQFAPTFIVLNP